jgi:hypothetical protein
LFLGAYKLALNKVLTNVDFPSPLSPTVSGVNTQVRTHDHDIEIESLANGLTVPLIG